jgi:peptide/nickel transport system substrate-binding protein
MTGRRPYAFARLFGRLAAAAICAAVAASCRCVSAGEDPAWLPPPAASAVSSGVIGDEWADGRLPPVSPDEKPLPGGEVVVQSPTEPPTLNPIVTSDWWGSHISDSIYEPLVGVDPYDDPRFRYVPKLAERWEISEDQLTYTFYLRRGVRWHDGKPFTARDVIATFDKIQDPATRAAHLRSYTMLLESYHALDDFTVRFRWKKPYFLAMSTPFGVGIQPAHVITKLSGKDYNESASNPINRAPVGTGPFKFVSWQTSERIVLAKNAAYWDKRAHLDRVVFRFVMESDIALQLARRGEVDVVNRVSSEQWMDMRDDAMLKAHMARSKFYDANYAWIGWNQKRVIFQDKRVRRALTLLIDRPGIIHGLLHGLAIPTTCHFYFRSLECDPALAPLPYDPVAAVKLLEEAGYYDADRNGVREKDGRELRFNFMIPAASEGAERMAAKMKEDFWRAGIDMGVQRVEWSAFVRRLQEKNFDACTLLWGGGPRGEPSQIWHSSSMDKGSNYIGFSNPRADALMDRAKTLFDDDARSALYREFGRILYDEQPYTFLYVRPNLTLVSRRVRGVRETLSFWQYQDWWIDPRGGKP